MRGSTRQLAFGLFGTLILAVSALAQYPQTVPSVPEPYGSKDTSSKAAPGTGANAGLRDLMKNPQFSSVLGDGKAAAPPDEGNAYERARLQAQLFDLVKRLNAAKAASSSVPNPTVAPKPTQVSPPTDGKPVSLPRAAMNNFRDNQFEVALALLTQIDPYSLNREESTFAQYLKACCLRRLNRLNEAAIAYREIADAHEDDFITECAIWQLSMMNAARDLEVQIEQLRSRTKTR